LPALPLEVIDATVASFEAGFTANEDPAEELVASLGVPAKTAL
jgi:hypothetical protein